MVRRMVLLVAAAMLAVMLVAGTALAAPGGNHKGIGEGIGGGNFANPDNGKQNGFGGGQLNNPHL